MSPTNRQRPGSGSAPPAREVPATESNPSAGAAPLPGDAEAAPTVQQVIHNLLQSPEDPGDEALLRIGQAFDTSRSARLFASVDGVVRRCLEQVPLATTSPQQPAWLRQLHLHIIRSFTTEPITAPLRSWGLPHRLLLEVSHGAYNQFEQELLQEGFTERDRPGVMVLWPRLEEVAPQLLHRYCALDDGQRGDLGGELLRRATVWLQRARTHTDGPVLFMGFPLPSRPAFGLADRRVPHGQREFIADLNGQLAALCRAQANSYFIDLDWQLASLGHEQAFDSRMEAHARQPFSPGALAVIARLVSRTIAATTTPRRKCVVLDCDNTLCAGILGEDGPEGIRLGPEHPGASFVRFQEALLNLQRNGIILAVASKNNEEEVLALLDSHPHQVLRRPELAAWRINWGDKATSIQELSSELNIGTDSMVFLDDSSFECELVRSRLPEVLTLQIPDNPLLLVEFLGHIHQLDFLDVSEEDQRRGAMYQEQAQRERARRSFDNLEDFYHSLQMKLRIDPGSAGNADRIAQLTQRTNQFNLTTLRYRRSRIEQLIASPSHHVHAIRLQDRYGDYGVCGVLILERRPDGDLFIDTMLLSCRVLGRGLEGALMAFVEETARSLGADRIIGLFRPTARNGQVEELFSRFGFSPLEVPSPPTHEDGRYWHKESARSSTTTPAWFDMEVDDDVPDNVTARANAHEQKEENSDHDR